MTNKATKREKQKARRVIRRKEEVDFLAPGILRALFELMDKGEELSVRNITDKVNKNYDEADRLGYREVGGILTALGISKKRASHSRAYTIHRLKSKQVLESLRRQYHL